MYPQVPEEEMGTERPARQLGVLESGFEPTKPGSEVFGLAMRE